MTDQMTDDQIEDLEASDSYFEMFSVSGNRIVARVLKAKLERISTLRADGFEPTEEKLASIVYEVQTEVASLGYAEAHDTAVREAIWAAVERS